MNVKKEKYCRYCGKEIGYWQRVFCCKSCNTKYHNEKRKKAHPKTVKNCVYCGKEYETNNPRQKYCCYDCKTMSRRKPEIRHDAPEKKELEKKLVEIETGKYKYRMYEKINDEYTAGKITGEDFAVLFDSIKAIKLYNSRWVKN